MDFCGFFCHCGIPQHLTHTNVGASSVVLPMCTQFNKELQHNAKHPLDKCPEWGTPSKKDLSTLCSRINDPKTPQFLQSIWAMVKVSLQCSEYWPQNEVVQNCVNPSFPPPSRAQVLTNIFGHSVAASTSYRVVFDPKNKRQNVAFCAFCRERASEFAWGRTLCKEQLQPMLAGEGPSTYTGKHL